MVEGHSVHRIASRFRQQLVGRRFAASSPNGRFSEGSRAIDGMVMSNIEAVGKNLFAFFSPPKRASALPPADHWDDSVVVHVHFGMSGAWSVHDIGEEPETKSTTRLRLVEQQEPDLEHKLVTHLSAMTCTHGGWELYTEKRKALGHDPLRADANPDELYQKVAKSKKYIGQLIMDQSYFAGPGNIYRAEILFLAGIHPETPGNVLDKASFERVWEASVGLLSRGYDTGSILTVDANIDPDVAARRERRYVYNRSHCARCSGPVRSWDMARRTCYACSGGCQPRLTEESNANETPNSLKKNMKGQRKSQKNSVEKPERSDPSQHVPFVSSCARDGLEARLSQQGPAGLTIAEIRSQILKIGGEQCLPPKSARKATHTDALAVLLNGGGAKKEVVQSISSTPLPPPAVSAEEAAREKAAAGEHRGVEHIAELSRDQAVKAAVITPLSEDHAGEVSGKEHESGASKAAEKTGRSESMRKSKKKRKLRYE